MVFIGFSEKCKPVSIGFEFTSKNLLNMPNMLEMKVLWMVLRTAL